MRPFDEVYWQAIPERDGTHRLWGMHYGDDYSYGTKLTLIGFGQPERKGNGTRKENRKALL